MLVDDSAVIRGLIARMITPDPEITVIASVPDGAQAVKRMSQRDIDVIVLDIEMPVMDGLTALPKLIEADPNVKIVMASTLTEKNADISLKALEAGAADYIPKPTSTSEIAGASNFRQELLEKIKILGTQARRDAGLPLPKTTTRITQTPTPASAPGQTAPGPAPKPQPAGLYAGPVTLRQANYAQKPKLLAIGSSTGGPQALLALFKDLSGRRCLHRSNLIVSTTSSIPGSMSPLVTSVIRPSVAPMPTVMATTSSNKTILSSPSKTSAVPEKNPWS